MNKEIERAVRKISTFRNNEKSITQSEKENLISKVKKAVEDLSFNFGDATTIVLRQGNKKRLVKQYANLYSIENIACQCIKQILDKMFKIKYANRGKIIKKFFGIIGATIQMSDFTIVKFDFKNYFNSVSSVYVYEKFVKERLENRWQIDLIKLFVESTKYAYAGLRTSNAIAEIIAKNFDNLLCQMFSSSGLIYYERYIDDGIFVLNRHVEKDKINELLNKALVNVFHDELVRCKIKCKTSFNNEKFKYITRRSLVNKNLSIDFLGYEFFLSLSNAKKARVDIKYGITEEKQKKYNDRLDNIISYYKDKNSDDFDNVELLRHRVAAFASREVYLVKHFKSYVWRVKGFIANYGELRYLLNSNPSDKKTLNLLDRKTENYLKNMIDDAFKRANLDDKLYFLRNNSKKAYNLYENMKINRTILLVENIGYDYKSLVKLCKKIGIDNIDSKGTRRSYDNLVRDYLIKIKVGY